MGTLPNEPMLKAFDAVCGQLSTAIANWRAIVANDLAAFNALLSKNGLMPVPGPTATLANPGDSLSLLAQTDTTRTNLFSGKLTFRLGEEVFALDIAQVREVLDYTQITRVPRMPQFMRGVINLRGSVVPVVDLRLKFGMAATERTVNTCIIIAEVLLGGERTLLGALADSVQEVIDLEAGQIEPPSNSFPHTVQRFFPAFAIVVFLPRIHYFVVNDIIPSKEHFRARPRHLTVRRRRGPKDRGGRATCLTSRTGFRKSPEED